MKLLTDEQRKAAKVQHAFAIEYLKSLEEIFPDSRDTGTVLSLMVGAFLRKAPTQKDFEEYKTAFIECARLVSYQ